MRKIKGKKVDGKEMEDKVKPGNKVKIRNKVRLDCENITGTIPSTSVTLHGLDSLTYASQQSVRNFMRKGATNKTKTETELWERGSDLTCQVSRKVGS